MGSDNATALSEAERKEAVLKELARSLGIPSPALRKTGTSRVEYERWLETDPEFSSRAHREGEALLDFAESCALERIARGDARLIKFVLETKGASRGYVKPSAKRAEPPAPAEVDPTRYLTEDDMRL